MIKPVLAARGRIGGPLAVGPGGVAALILDEFTAANGTAISGRTPAPVNVPGNNWVIIGTGSWTIQGDKATKTGGGAQNFAIVDAEDADITLTCDVTVVNANELQGVGLRVTDTNNFWIFTWRNTNLIQIGERTAGSFNVRASTALILTPGNTYEFKVVANGQTITGYVDGVQYVTYGSATAHQSVTNHGLYVGSTSPTWDNFKVLA